MVNFIIILAFVILWIAATFMSMFILPGTFFGNIDLSFEAPIIIISALFWCVIIPICAIVWIIKAIAYPFRKSWW